MQHYADETNSISAGYHPECWANQHPDYPQGVEWTHPGLKITRLRLLSDPGHPVWDVSYCHGVLDGKHVDVGLPFSTLPKRAVARTIIEYAKRDKVYAKGIGILDCVSKLW